MRVSPAALDVVKKWEGFEPEAYLCPAGVWTIGYGHTGNVKAGDRISEYEALHLLDYDLDWAEDAVNRLVKVPLTQSQFDALVSFVFNVGEKQFASSTMLRKLNSKDYSGAADEFPKWKYAKGKILKGLINRRADERALFLADPVHKRKMKTWVSPLLSFLSQSRSST